MNPQVLKANIMLSLAAFFWGTCFVGQRIGMEHLGPLTFTAVRFTLGIATLIPVALYCKKRMPVTAINLTPFKKYSGIILLGIVLFTAINFQQTALITTTAGNAGFITGLYVIFVPILGLFIGMRTHHFIWLGALMGGCGLYLLSVQAGFKLMPGDGLVVICAVACALHVLIIGWLSPRMNPFTLSLGQSITCAVISWILAILTEPISWAAIREVWFVLLWTGVMSVTIAFTLQIMGQKSSPPAHAAIILSLESVFAAFFGWLILDEQMGGRALIGATLMLTGMIVSQIPKPTERNATGL